MFSIQPSSSAAAAAVNISYAFILLLDVINLETDVKLVRHCSQR